MTESDKPRLAAALAVIGEFFGEPVSGLRAEGYFVGLDGLTIAEVERACKLSLAHCKFFPKPVELRELVAGGSLKDGSLLAWADLVREVRRVGYIGAPRLPAATLDVVASLWGSWKVLCETLPNEGPELLGWMGRFERLYEAQHHQRRALPKHDVRELLD